MKLYRTKVPVYDKTVLFGIGTRFEYLEFVVERFNEVPEPDFFVFKGITQTHFDYKKNKVTILLWLNSEIPHKEWRPVFEHELFHVTVGLLDVCGMKVADESEEGFAYVHDYIFSKFNPKLEEALNAKTKGKD